MRKFQNKTPPNCHTRAQKAGKTETLATMSPGAADRTPNPTAAALARTRGGGLAGAPAAAGPGCEGRTGEGRGQQGRASTPGAIPPANWCQASSGEDLLQGWSPSE